MSEASVARDVRQEVSFTNKSTARRAFVDADFPRSDAYQRMRRRGRPMLGKALTVRTEALQLIRLHGTDGVLVAHDVEYLLRDFRRGKSREQLKTALLEDGWFTEQGDGWVMPEWLQVNAPVALQRAGRMQRERAQNGSQNARQAQFENTKRAKSAAKMHSRMPDIIEESAGSLSDSVKKSVKFKKCSGVKTEEYPARAREASASDPGLRDGYPPANDHTHTTPHTFEKTRDTEHASGPDAITGATVAAAFRSMAIQHGKQPWDFRAPDREMAASVADAVAQKAAETSNPPADVLKSILGAFMAAKSKCPKPRFEWLVENLDQLLSNGPKRQKAPPEKIAECERRIRHALATGDESRAEKLWPIFMQLKALPPQELPAHHRQECRQNRPRSEQLAPMARVAPDTLARIQSEMMSGMGA